MACKVHESRRPVPQAQVGCGGTPAQARFLGQVPGMSRNRSTSQDIAAAHLAGGMRRIQKDDASRILARQLSHGAFAARRFAGSHFGSLQQRLLSSAAFKPYLSGAQSAGTVAPATMPQQLTPLVARASLSAAVSAENLGGTVETPTFWRKSLANALEQSSAAPGTSPRVHLAQTPLQNDGTVDPKDLTLSAASMSPPATTGPQPHPAPLRSAHAGNPAPDQVSGEAGLWQGLDPLAEVEVHALPAAPEENGTEQQMSDSEWEQLSKVVDEMFGTIGS